MNSFLEINQRPQGWSRGHVTDFSLDLPPTLERLLSSERNITNRSQRSSHNIIDDISIKSRTGSLENPICVETSSQILPPSVCLEINSPLIALSDDEQPWFSNDESKKH